MSMDCLASSCAVRWAMEIAEDEKKEVVWTSPLILETSQVSEDMIRLLRLVKPTTLC